MNYLNIRSRIVHLAGAPARYFHKMYLQADILGWQADLEVARRQDLRMPELERILEEEIALARAAIGRIDKGCRQEQTFPSSTLKIEASHE